MIVMRTATVLAFVFACGCHANPPAEPQVTLETLTGTIIRKEWNKSYESWNAGGSEYYVLKVEETDLPGERRTVHEGVILRPSDAIPFEHFANFVGRMVTCQGAFVAGEPDLSPDNGIEQRPMSIQDPITGEAEQPVRGSGFKVYAIRMK